MNLQPQPCGWECSALSWFPLESFGLLGFQWEREVFCFLFGYRKLVWFSSGWSSADTLSVPDTALSCRDRELQTQGGQPLHRVDLIRLHTEQSLELPKVYSLLFIPGCCNRGGRRYPVSLLKAMLFLQSVGGERGCSRLSISHWIKDC